MRIAVAGATGTVGRHVVEVARERGHRVVLLSRRAGHDVTSGDVSAALGGVDVIVDVLGIQTLSRRRATRFFEAASETLHRSGARAGVSHLVALSIVGIDGVDSAYYGAKLAHERAVAAGALPFTLLRAAQFHEFAQQTISRGSLGPVVAVPAALVRPVAAREVADELLRRAEGAPLGRVRDLVGPRDEVLVEMVRAVLAHRGSSRASIPFALPGRMGRAMVSGQLRGTDDARRGTTTFSEWLRSADAAR